MPQSSHLHGPALRALAAGPSSFTPPDGIPLGKTERDRIWELADTLHCSIVGTCLTVADSRSLLAKLGAPDARTMTEHRLHGQVVQIAGRREGGGKLLQKMLDRRHEAEIARFDTARTSAEVRALWKASLAQGEIPGAYWAAMTHPATDWALVQDIFGEVHMLSHLVGQSNRADIRRLRQLELDLGARDERVAEQERRIAELSGERDALGARNRVIVAESLCARAAELADPLPADLRESIRGLEARLAREQAHAEALEEKVAVLLQVSGRLSAELDTETRRRQVAEAERAAVAAMLGQRAPEEEASATPLRLDGRTLLYVGGRPRQVAGLRRFCEAHGGRLLSHDGGIEDNVGLLPGLVGQAEAVLFPVQCISHEASATVKRACEIHGRPMQPVRSASLASFVHALAPGNAAALI